MWKVQHASKLTTNMIYECSLFDEKLAAIIAKLFNRQNLKPQRYKKLLNTNEDRWVVYYEHNVD